LFLNVFEVPNEEVREATATTLDVIAGVRIGDRRRARFNPTAPLGGRVEERSVTMEVRLEGQY